MTTPEQLQAWREEFEAQLLPATEMTLDVMGKYWLNGLETQWQGYLRRCQETEQIMKLAKFGAMVAISYVNGERFVPVHELDNLAMDYGVVDSAFVFTSDTKTTIKELLNDGN